MATIKLIALPGGEVQLFVDGDITYADASQRTQQILAYLRENGVPLELISGIEQHRDPGATHVHVVALLDTR
jgi:hypothetical protein